MDLLAEFFALAIYALPPEGTLELKLKFAALPKPCHSGKDKEAYFAAVDCGIRP